MFTECQKSMYIANRKRITLPISASHSQTTKSHTQKTKSHTQKTKFCLPNGNAYKRYPCKCY